MTVGVGSFGRLRVFEDFLGAPEVAAMTTVAASVGNVGYVTVNEGSFAPTVDEPGGILAITTDTADNDNCAVYAGPFKPADGGCAMEARFKMADITTGAVYCGFSETLDATTPVMPAEFATATMTYNGTGSIIGIQFDSDGTGTTDDWRAVFGDAAAAKSNADANGTRAYEAAVNDEWDVVRVEIGADATARVLLNGRVIKEIADACTVADVQHACLIIENRSAAASVLEVDYFYAEGGRDWTV